MIYINDNTKKLIDSCVLNQYNTYAVFDFDRTITEDSSYNSWGILENSNFVCEEYTMRSKELYDKYYPIEFDYSLDKEIKDNLMKEWWRKIISMFVEYRLREEIVINATSNVSLMKFRDGAKEYLEYLNKLNIPVIIISAGIGNFIELFLKYTECLFDNIYIVSNFIKFEDGVAVGIEDEIIHSQNKSDVCLNKNISEKISNRDYILLFGDNLSDIHMVSEDKRNNTIRIGFLDNNTKNNLSIFRDNFDIVCTDNESFNNIPKIINKEKIKIKKW